MPIHENPEFRPTLDVVVAFRCDGCDSQASGLVVAQDAQIVEEHMPNIFVFLERRCLDVSPAETDGSVAKGVPSDML